MAIGFLIWSWLKPPNETVKHELRNASDTGTSTGISSDVGYFFGEASLGRVANTTWRVAVGLRVLERDGTLLFDRYRPIAVALLAGLDDVNGLFLLLVLLLDSRRLGRAKYAIAASECARARRGPRYGDMKYVHDYPGPKMFSVGLDRASILGKFGGLGLLLESHLLVDR